MDWKPNDLILKFNGVRGHFTKEFIEDQNIDITKPIFIFNNTYYRIGGKRSDGGINVR